MLSHKRLSFSVVAIIVCFMFGFVSCEQIEPAVPPVACFDVSATEIMVTESITFTSCSENAMAVYWKLEEDIYIKGNSISHTFNNPGEYIIDMVVYNKSLRDSRQTKINVIQLEDGQVHVTTKEVFGITSNSVFAGGKVIVNNVVVNERGICWSEEVNPNINGNKIQGESNDFSIELTELKNETKYYVRAYAISSEGMITYGSILSFTTLSAGADEVEVITKDVQSVTSNSVIAGGLIIANGNTITERGVCWSKTANPTTESNKKVADSNDFNIELTDLAFDTDYYLRAYAKTDKEEIIYGNELYFKTLIDNSLVTFTIGDAEEITAFSAKFNCSVVAKEEVIIESYGLIWCTNPDFELGDEDVVIQHFGIGSGEFIGGVNGLMPSTLYYVKIYASTSNNGKFYSNEKEFITSVETNIVQTEPSEFTADEEVTVIFNAKGGDGGLQGYTGDVYAHIGLNTSIGQWEHTIADWTVNLDKVKMERLSDDYYILKIKPDVREFFGVTNASEIVQQIAVVFRSDDGTLSGRMADGSDIIIDVVESSMLLPQVKTYAPSFIGSDKIVAGGEIIHDGNAWISSYGICWGTDPNPVIEYNAYSQDGSGWEKFTSDITGLNENTTYYIRAYGINEVGTGYGEEIVVTTTSSDNVLFYGDFSDFSNDEIINTYGWSQYLEVGYREWTAKEYNFNQFAQISAYGSGESNVVSLISPSIDLSYTINNTLTFDVKVGYWNHIGLEVYVLDNDDMSSANWIDITDGFTIPTEPTDNYGEFINAGSYDLSSFSGIVYIAFKYSGDDNAGLTTTYQIDNVLVEGE